MPKDYEIVKGEEGAAGSGIDWEEIAEDDELELWTVRIPDGVGPCVPD